MLESLKALVEPRQHGDHWKVEKQGSYEKIVVVHGANHRVANLIDFVRSVQFASAALSSVKEEPLSQQEKERLFLPLAETSITLQRGIAELSFIRRIVLHVIQYLFTGTSISGATKTLESAVYSSPELHNPVAAKLAYPRLFRDAEYAQTCLAAYQEVAKKYALPSVADTLGNGKQALKNPLLYYLRQILAEEWHQLNSLVKQGKGVDDPVVKNRIDVAMQTALVLAKLALTHERSFYSPPYKELTKMDQDKYAFWIMYTISNFYGWLRSCSPADSLDVSWQRTYEEICSLGQDNGIKFGDELHIDQRNFMPNEAFLTEQLMVKKL